MIKCPVCGKVFQSLGYPRHRAMHYDHRKDPEIMNCPVMEQTGDGKIVGRCWFYLPDGKTCPRHGDVTKAILHYKKTGKTLLEELK